MEENKRIYKLKNTINKLIGTEKEFERKLCKIYGFEGHEKIAAKLREQNMKIFIVGVLLIIGILGLIIYQGFKEEDYFILDERGNGSLKSVVNGSESGKQIDLRARGINDKEQVSDIVTLNIEGNKKVKEEVGKSYISKSDQWKEMLKGEIRKIQASQGNGKFKEVRLPTRLSNGMKVYWERPMGKTWLIPLIFMGIFLYLIYKNKFFRINRIQAEAKKSIEDELPNFINKIVLMMISGMVFDVAFEKAVVDSMKINITKNSYFYSQMEKALRNSREHRNNLVDELYNFAKRNENREMIRVVNLIGDNLKKGDKLTEKLQMESQIMWFNKKKNMEEKGRLSEAKLVFPMVIMLGILVVITVAPALIDM